MKLVLSALLLIPALSWAQATPAPQAIDSGVIVRVDSRDGNVSLATAEQKIVDAAQAQTLVADAAFSTIAADNRLGELDREVGASSWYCYYQPYYPNYTYMYWYGSYYQPFYTYQYSYYTYYYYSSYGWWRW